MSELYDEIRQRLTEQFQRLARGDDLPPGPRFRLEGLMEAAVISGDTEQLDLQRLISELYITVFGDTPEQRLGQNWERWHPFPEIPAFATRAPVSPSTSD